MWPFNKKENAVGSRGPKSEGLARMLPELKPVSLDELSDIRCTCFLGKHPTKTYSKRILVIRFEGTYRFGSSGKTDADFIGAMGRAAVHAFDPAGQITDFSALGYEWGDNMSEVVCGFGDDQPMPYGLVVGDGCRAGLGTLFSDGRGTSHLFDTEWVFDSLEKAWKYVTQQLDSMDS